MTYLKINDTLYPATFFGRIADKEWDNRESKAITLQMAYEEAIQLFVNGLSWSIYLDEENEEIDNSDFEIVGDITVHQSGKITVKMGKKTAQEILTELEATYNEYFSE